MLKVALPARSPVAACAARARGEALPHASSADESNGELRVAYLRDLRGDDELRLADPDFATLDDLLAQLLLEIPGAAFGPGNLSEASVGDRDLLVAALYTQCFGDDVDIEVRCADCGEAFEVRCSLAEEIATMTEAGEQAFHLKAVAGPDAQGFYQLPGGQSFRLPTVADEQALRRVSPARRRNELLARCVRANREETGAGPVVVDEEDGVLLEQAMQALDPGASPTLRVPCAMCRALQAIELDIVELFLSTLAREAPLLAREIHSLASAYHWSLQEIVGLSRRQRHAQVALVEAGRESEGMHA